MWKAIKRIIRQLTPRKVKEFFAYQEGDEYAKISYSVCGEDLILSGLLNSKKSGFYLDIGANHPIRFSNTYHFYKLGWTGICIDPLPESKDKFEITRPRDVFINKALGSSGNLNYYQFEQSAYNTTNADIAKTVPSKLIRKEVIPILELKSVLSDHFEKNFTFDFANIDVEGHEYEILSSHDWTNYPINVICVEIHELSLLKVNQHPIAILLGQKGYQIVAKNRNNLFFQKEC